MIERSIDSRPLPRLISNRLSSQITNESMYAPFTTLDPSFLHHAKVYIDALLPLHSPVKFANVAPTEYNLDMYCHRDPSSPPHDHLPHLCKSIFSNVNSNQKMLCLHQVGFSPGRRQPRGPPLSKVPTKCRRLALWKSVFEQGVIYPRRVRPVGS